MVEEPTIPGRQPAAESAIAADATVIAARPSHPAPAQGAATEGGTVWATPPQATPPQAAPPREMPTQAGPVRAEPAEPRRSDGGERTVPPGSLLNHTYRVGDLLGRGGMGEVYRATHIVLGTEHAIKVILPELANQPRVAEMFVREATALRKFRHDAVVAYEGAFSDQDGRLFLVMEFVEGPSLSQVIRQRALTPAEVRLLRDRLAAGFAAAHAKGIVHRDVSPDNVILPGGRLEDAKIIDFGIAKNTDPAAAATIIGNDFAGKFSFVSPEQLGMFGGEVDGRSDIYSLGLVLVAAAVGESLNMGTSMISVVEARRGVPDLGRVPEELRDDLAAMLQPDPKDRPQTMQALISAPLFQPSVPPAEDATRTILAEAPVGVPARPPANGGVATAVPAAAPLGKMPAKAAPKGRAPVGLLVAAAVLAVLGGGAGVYFLTSAGPETPPGTDAPGQRVEPPDSRIEPSSARVEPPPAVGGGGPAGGPRPIESPTPVANTPAPETGQQQEPPRQGQGGNPPAGTVAGGGSASPVPVVPAADPVPPARVEPPPQVAQIPPAPDIGAIRRAVEGITAGFDCASLSATVAADAGIAVSGFLSRSEDLTRLRSQLAAIPQAGRQQLDVAVYEWPFCKTIGLLQAHTVLGGDGAGAVEIRPNNAGLVYREGERLVLDVGATDRFAGHLHVAYVDKEGSVTHLLPGSAVTAGQRITLGGRGEYQIGPPFGRDMIVAISSRQPLFDRPRSQSESAANYFAALDAALQRAAASGGSGRPVGRYVFITSVPAGQ